jgi:Ca2+-binding RTX toxin-like protein
MTINGTSGNDTLTGTSGADLFNLAQGGNDTVSGLGGNDLFSFGAAFTNADHIDGGAGTDTLKLSGDYSGGVDFTAATMVNVEKILLSAGHSYNLQLVDANVAAGASLAVNGAVLGAGDTLIFFDSAESDGNLTIVGGAGADSISSGLHHTTINGGAGNDSIYLLGGLNSVNGGDGDDLITVENPIASNSHIDGGTGSNQIFFNGDFSAGQVIGAHMATNISDIGLAGGHSYNFTLQNGLVASGHQLPIYGNGLESTDTVRINGSHLTQGNLYLQGGHGSDVLIGGAGNDGLEGREGADVMTGGGGADRFYYNGVADSTSSTFDRITDFNATTDHIQLPSSVTAIDTAVSGGTVTATHFDANLAAAVGAAQLHAGDAVLFTPSGGYLSGHTLLVIDANGVAGYQAGADYVIDVTGMTGTLTAGDL